MKNLVFILISSILFFACKETKKDISNTPKTQQEVESTFIPKDFSLLFSTTPNSYFPLLFQMKKEESSTPTNLADIKSLLTFLKLDEKIYAFNRGKQLSGVSFNIHDSTTYRTFLSDKFVCEFSKDEELEFAQTQFNEFTLYSVWTNNRAVIIQSFDDLSIEKIKVLAQVDNCIPFDELNTYDSKELITYHLQIPDSILNQKSIILQGTIDLKDSSIVITSNITQNGSPFELFNTPKEIKLPKGLFSGFISLSANAKSLLTDKTASLPELQKLLNNWSGQISWVYSGTGTTEKEIITYDWDDDYNQIEIKKTSSEGFFKINGAITMNSNQSANEVLKYLDKRGYLSKKENQYTSTFFTDMTKFSSEKNNIVVRSIKKPIKQTIQTTSFFLSIDNRKNNLIEHLKLPKINLKRFKPLARHINYLTITSPNTNSAVLELQFDQAVVPALQALIVKSSRF